MSYLAIAQYMAAATFITVSLTHLLVWARVRREVIHLLFALTAAAAGANAIAEQQMYQSASIEHMRSALRWYVGTSGFWAIAIVCYIADYSKSGRVGRRVAAVIVLVCCVAIVINFFSPASFLYSELTGLREIVLPWGERIWLAQGIDSTQKPLAEVAWYGLLVIAAIGCVRFWRRNQRIRAICFGSAVVSFVICFGTHAFLVDTGRINSPYLSTYGFLALVGLMSYDLAGEVMRQAELSSQLAKKEREIRTAVEDERNRIAGDLHDSVTQTLFSTAAIADALPEVWRRSPDDAKRGLEDLRSLTKGALAEMRTLLLELHPATLCQKGLNVLLRQLADATIGRTRVPVEVRTEGKMSLPDDVKITLYRVAQESINNALKHAEPKRIWLSLVCNNPHATLTIRDDGCGFDVAADTSGMGLQFMRERVASIGGQLELQSEQRIGTTITVHWSRE